MYFLSRCNLRILFLLGVLLTLSPDIAIAELQLGSLFTDHAVLQRDQAVPIWGTAEAGESVTVEFGDQKKSVTADDQGKWQTSLDPMPANAVGLVLIASTAKSKVSINDIVVGEVWICSGQSNMQMEYKRVPEVAALTDKVTKLKTLRSFKVKNTVAFTEQETCKGTWKVGPPESAVAFAFAFSLEKIADVPIGIIQTSWGSSSIEAWMPRDMTETVPHFKTMMKEFDADKKTHNRIASILKMPKGWKGQDDVFLRRQPNVLYNAMMHPLAPYACRGLVWYQGERNTQSMLGMISDPWFARNSGMLKYGETLKAWITRYRKLWQKDDMQFLIVMLPGYYKPAKTEPGLKRSDKGPDNPASHSWAWMRESQLAALDLPHVAVVNTIDLGDVKNVHPKDKLPIGQRLALLASEDMVSKDVKARGPVFKNAVLQDEEIIVRFDHADNLMTKDGKSPTGFWLANDAKKWVRAKAKIENNTVVLRSSELKDPLYVRYAFAGKPEVNLVNEAKLPAYPFRTDTFGP